MDKDQDISGTATAGQPAAAVAPKADEASAEQQIAELKDRLLRSLAEIENVRRRADKEREDTAKYAVSSFAREIVSVADNLRRTLDSAQKGSDGDGVLKALLEGVAVMGEAIAEIIAEGNA